jgi:hypothetical protein
VRATGGALATVVHEAGATDEVLAELGYDEAAHAAGVV